MKTSHLLATLRWGTLLLLSTAAAALLLAPAAASGAPFTFSNTGSLATPRVYHTATLLPNGQVLVAGGQNLVPGAESDPGLLASAELYDPVSGTWTATASLAHIRVNHTATLLPNGKVLVVGGYGGNYNGNAIFEASAELYDPASGTWSATTGNLGIGRSHHTATLLLNGKVLVAGGHGPNDTAVSAELYDPGSGTNGSFSATGSLTDGRLVHNATLLPNGTVLVAGGFGIDNSDNNGRLASAELYDPASGTWAATGSLTAARGAATATLLPNNTVLMTGGGNNLGSLNSELYDPASGTWTVTGRLGGDANAHTATLLPNGQVLVVQYGLAELYDPASGTWAATGDVITSRWSPTATLLADGNVLVAAGLGFPYDEVSAIASAELYDSASGTPQERTALIIPQVQGLVTAGALGSNQGASLTNKLNSVISKLNNGQTGPASNQLGAFSNQVGGFIHSGALTPAQGQPLIDAATAVRSQIGG